MKFLMPITATLDRFVCVQVIPYEFMYLSYFSLITISNYRQCIQLLTTDVWLKAIFCKI